MPPGLNKTYIRTILNQLGAFYSPDVLYTDNELEVIERLLDYNNLDTEQAALQLVLPCEETLLR
jgi:predicted DNA-binding protein (UPF0251 family)